jgi:hypothetical protein
MPEARTKRTKRAKRKSTIGRPRIKVFKDGKALRGRLSRKWRCPGDCQTLEVLTTEEKAPKLLTIMI